MAGLVTSEAQAALDNRFPTSGGTDSIAWSVNGSSEWANLARTAVGATGWAAATAADPSVKANANILTSAAVTTAGGTVTHFAVTNSGGTLRTDWTALDTPRALSVGDSLQAAVGALKVTLT